MRIGSAGVVAALSDWGLLRDQEPKRLMLPSHLAPRFYPFGGGIAVLEHDGKQYELSSMSFRRIPPKGCYRSRRAGACEPTLGSRSGHRPLLVVL